MLMLKILVVEDDDSLLNLYRIVLEKQGYEVLPAHHGEEAWDIMEREHVDFLFPFQTGKAALLPASLPPPLAYEGPCGRDYKTPQYEIRTYSHRNGCFGSQNKV